MNMAAYRVAAGCFEPAAADSIEERRDALRSHLAALLDEQRPDLLVLPETAVVEGIGREHRCGAEPLDGPTVGMVARTAAVRKVNICIPIIEDDGGDLYNTAVYVDRSGAVAGVYRKQVPTPGEIEAGIRPGAPGQPATTLDGLRIGTAICFDCNFPDQIWHWIETGVDLLVFPAYTYAGDLVRGWAVNCGVPLVCAFPWESVVYDRDGSVRAAAGTETSTVRLGRHRPWIGCTLDMRSRVYHLDGNQEKLAALAARYGATVDVRLMVRDGRMLLSAARGEDIERIERELGLTPLQEYLRAGRSLAGLALRRNRG